MQIQRIICNSESIGSLSWVGLAIKFGKMNENPFKGCIDPSSSYTVCAVKSPSLTSISVK